MAEFINREKLPKELISRMQEYGLLLPIVVATIEGEIVYIFDDFFSGDEGALLGQDIGALLSEVPETSLEPQPLAMSIDTGEINLEAIVADIGDGESVRVYIAWPKDDAVDSESASVVYFPSPLNRFAMFAFVHFKVATIQHQVASGLEMIDELHKEIAQLKETLAKVVTADDPDTPEDESATDDWDSPKFR